MEKADKARIVQIGGTHPRNCYPSLFSQWSQMDDDSADSGIRQELDVHLVALMMMQEGVLNKLLQHHLL